MKRVFALISALIVALVVSACTSLIEQDADLEVVKGTLTYKERIALPDNARITVTLADVSKMDVAAEVLSRQAFLADGKQVPFEYQLNFSRQEIVPNHTYAVSARIEVDGKLLFITDTANHVLTDQSESTYKDLVLVKVN
ncbi:YbaY family lipoprotein [Photobacterium sp. DNB23_23_1]|uniref:YbaY family lipoprotein n=1 Tax=Photobacterium pectinilyticum TaxID=2906793 RepID=A0ABT1N4E2_9GAMM|nr:YbaY family lipoprotein [Photobacterium sp. ZSDE20]MCQ1059575.1 YbaY family lipoprotein [Photobacterium sp. ZSDE20]MDD1825438.1 YbaY family lipoprotein [Photobacterium sp. ZSDE20]